MSIESKVRAFAGAVVIAGSLLAWFHSPYWLALTAFVGVNLLQSSVTRFCPLESCLSRRQQT